jgi:hypothetical protein
MLLNYVTAWYRLFLEALIGVQLAKKFPAFSNHNVLKKFPLLDTF